MYVVESLDEFGVCDFAEGLNMNREQALELAREMMRDGAKWVLVSNGENGGDAIAFGNNPDHSHIARDR